MHPTTDDMVDAWISCHNTTSAATQAMAIDSQHRLLLFGAAAAVRLLLFTLFPTLPDVLAGRVEVSTPVTSFKRRMSCHVYLNIPLPLLTPHSPRRPLPLHAQCLALRWRRLPPGASPTAALCPAVPSRRSPSCDLRLLHPHRPAERAFISPAGRHGLRLGHATVRFPAKGPEME